MLTMSDLEHRLYRPSEVEQAQADRRSKEIQLANWLEHMKVFEEYSRIYGATHPKTLRIKKGIKTIRP